MVNFITYSIKWRLTDIGDPDADPPIPAIIPVGRSTWWDGVKNGRFPKPVKLRPRTTAWRVEDLREWIEQVASNG